MNNQGATFAIGFGTALALEVVLYFALKRAIAPWVNRQAKQAIIGALPEVVRPVVAPVYDGTIGPALTSAVEGLLP